MSTNTRKQPRIVVALELARRMWTLFQLITGKMAFQIAMDFENRPLRVVACPAPALSVLCNPDGHSNPLCGIEAKIVQILAERINATPVLQLVPNPEGQIYIHMCHYHHQKGSNKVHN